MVTSFVNNSRAYCCFVLCGTGHCLAFVRFERNFFGFYDFDSNATFLDSATLKDIGLLFATTSTLEHDIEHICGKWQKCLVLLRFERNIFWFYDFHSNATVFGSTISIRAQPFGFCDFHSNATFLNPMTSMNKDI